MRVNVKLGTVPNLECADLAALRWLRPVGAGLENCPVLKQRRAKPLRKKAVTDHRTPS
jgi:hypothetical protein